MLAAKFMRWKYKVVMAIVVLLLLYDYMNGLAFVSIFVHQVKSIKAGEKLFIVMKKVTNDKVYCPTLSLRKQRYDYTNNSCKPRDINPSDCYSAYKKYMIGLQDSTCPKNSPSVVYAELCKFIKNTNDNSNKRQIKVKCNIHLCDGNPIRIGVLQPNYGLLIRPEFWYIARGESTLEYVINKVIAENIRKGLDFCILKCQTKNKGEIKQALAFPPFLKLHSKKSWQTKNREKRKMNVNIVVLDSVSRQHFYRQLPKSVNMLKIIEANGHNVYDFELFQSIAPRTFPNMRALFSGIIDVDSEDEHHTYGLDSLFGKYSNLGYQTLLQEDSCWFDSWGALITDNKHSKEKLESPEQYSATWQNLQLKLRNLPIDSYGMTHFSCDVFLQYGKTNQFNHPPKVCFNGHHLSEYFLNYTYDFLQSIEQKENSYPGFVYTHLNTGHEMSGKRIAYVDAIFSRFVEDVTKLKNTLTLIISDHGPKTTRFSREFLSGRYETSHALMFIILPSHIKNHFTLEQKEALNQNQYRLINHRDLFHTLMSLHVNKSDGILTPISKSRHCDDMPMYAFMTCLCNASTEDLGNSDRNVHWLAEYSIGYLNNLITNSLSSEKGYGNCERLVGKRFEKIRKKVINNNEIIYTFDLIIHKYRDEEVFEVAVKTTTFNNNITTSMLKWRRVSVFQHYAKCVDNNVNIELCICRKESYTLKNPGRDASKIMTMKSFGLETHSEFVDSKCLTMLYRYEQQALKTFEVTNFCSDRVYNVTVQLLSHKAFSATSTGVTNLIVNPWLIYYVGTVRLSEDLAPVDVLDNVSFTYHLDKL